MNLEQLQNMTDIELNKLSALKVMGWSIHEVPHATFYEDGHGDPTVSVDAWKPTADMNDATELLGKFMDWAISINHGLNDWICRLSEGYINGAVNVSVQCDSLPRAITLASILAKTQ